MVIPANARIEDSLLSEGLFMKTGVLLLNFGEPEHAAVGEVIPFLEKIFLQNASLLGRATAQQVRERSRRLAEERAPGLIAEYQEIGGSPLFQQAQEQADALRAELRERGIDAVVLLGMQFTDPSIAEAVATARREDVGQIVALPVYPLAGPSTSVAALQEVDAELERQGWDVPVRQVTGWHRHPAYLRLRADAIRHLLEEHDLSLGDGETQLVFSAHGTPMKYIEEGSRYNDYVLEFCAHLADALGVADYRIGYQNHANRPGVRWTEPGIEEVIAAVDAKRVIVDPVSFMHEQSETLAELDHELREQAEGRGLEFFRVPIPHLAPEFIAVLADLVAPFVGPNGIGAEGTLAGAQPQLRPCQCKQTPGTFCTNAPPER
jgi:protoporphyrin/coproporphyrin ferrochelatase